MSEESKQNVFFISCYVFHLFLSLKGHVLYIYKKHSHLHKYSFQSPSNTASPLFTTHFFLTSFYISSSFYETCFILKSFQVKKRLCTFLSHQILGRLSLRLYRPFSERCEFRSLGSLKSYTPQYPELTSILVLYAAVECYQRSSNVQ